MSFTPYATRAEADTYFMYRLNTDAWDDSSDGDKDKALGMATHLIDRLNFRGDKADSEQFNQFPRGNDSEVPQDVKNATSEIALALLDGVDPELEFENLRMKSQGYGVIRSTYDTDSTLEHIAAGIPSSLAWRFLKPYLRSPKTVDFSRVT